jgi:DNA repair exonuclease SbcCD ATPase subunit
LAIANLAADSGVRLREVGGNEPDLTVDPRDSAGKTLNGTRSEVAELRALTAELKAENRQLKAQCSRLMRERQDSASDQSLRSLGEELGTALAEKSAAELQFEQAAREAAASAEALRLLRQELTAKEARAVSAEQKAAAVSQALEAALAAGEQAQSEAAEFREQLERRLTEGDAERQRLVTERDEMLATHENLLIEAARREKSATHLRRRLESAEQRLQQLVDVCSALSQEIETGEGRRAQLEEQALQATRQLDELNEVLATLRNEIGCLNAERDLLITQLSGLHTELGQLQQHASWAHHQIAALAENEVVLDTRLRDLSAQLSVADEQATECKRLLGVELPPEANLVDGVRLMHRRLRELERELDVETAARERVEAELAIARQSRFTAAALWRWLRPLTIGGHGLGMNSQA